VILWRVAAETRKYAADDLSGGGAAAHPGRWNEAKQPVVYAAPTIAMAVLETAAHVDAGGLPLNRFLVRIDVPEGDWMAREELDPAKLPPAWSAIPAGRTSVKIGTDWLTSARTLILLVPSVIVPEERAALINPLHFNAKKLSASVVRTFAYDTLFRS
jgi:RES domain-containing protein